MRHTLAQALDDCITRIRRDGDSIEHCLAAHPQHAAQLKPLLVLAQRMTAETAPAARPDARQRIDRRLDQLLATHRAPLWSRIFPPAAYRLALGSAVAMVVLAVIAFAGAGIAAQQAVPGDTLYGVRLATERAEMAVRRDAPLTEHQRLSTRRLAELRALVERGDTVNGAQAAKRYEAEHQALLRAAAAAPPVQAEAAQRLAAAQVIELAALRDRTGATAAPVSELLARLGSQTPPALAVAKSGDASTAEAARAAPPPASSQLPAPAGHAPAARYAGVFVQLLSTTAAAERAGVITAAQSAELTVLLSSASTLNIGGEHAVVATAVGRLGAALAACVAGGCATQAALTPLIESVHASALALGLPPPPALMVQSSPPIAAPRVAASPAARPAATTPVAAPRSAATSAPPAPTRVVTGSQPVPAASGAAAAPPVPAAGSGPVNVATPSGTEAAAPATRAATPPPAAMAPTTITATPTATPAPVPSPPAATAGPASQPTAAR